VESVTKIYVLIDPRNQEIRYVGKTTQRLSDRLSCHRTGARRGDRDWRSRWIAKLLRCGYDPIILLVQEVDSTEWDLAENYWIKYYRSMGCRLTNGTEGGEDGPVFTAEVRAQRSAALTGVNNPFFGREHSPQTRRRISEARTGSTATPETKAILSAAAKTSKFNSGRFQPGMTVSEAGRKRRSETAKRVNCQRWYINRDKQCICGYHTD